MPGMGIFLFLSGLVLFLYGLGFRQLLLPSEDPPCSMTYMFEYPQYVKISLPEEISRTYKRYSLYAYGEGHHTSTLRKMRFTGIPVLFIPGNAGSYKQARSLASVSLRKALNSRIPFHMDFFTVDLNEEYSALYGGALKPQTEFVQHSIARILKLYKQNKGIQPTSVVLVGHSMGGLIAKGIFNDLSFDSKTVQVIITLATPHRPAILLDEELSKYYNNVTQTWQQLRTAGRLSHVTLASIGGGDKDKLVRSGLISSWEIDMHTVTATIPTVWRSVDHLCIVWCKELVLVLVRALFDLVDSETRQISTDKFLRRAVLTYHLLQRNANKEYSSSIHTQPVRFHSEAEWTESLLRQYTVTGNMDKTGADKLTTSKYVMIRLVDHPHHALLAVEAVNQDLVDWVFVCNAVTIVKHSRTCAFGESLSNNTMLLPSLHHKRKRVVLDLLWLQKLEKFSHVVLKMPATSEHIQFNIDVHGRRALKAPSMNWLSVISGRSVTILEKTEKNAIRYEIEFPDVESAWHVTKLRVKPLSCSRNKHHAVAMLLVPWSNEKSFAFITESREDPLLVKVLHFKSEAQDPKTKSDVQSSVRAELTLDPACTYSISIESAPKIVLGQMVRVYTPGILPYVVAILLLTLREQLHSLRRTGSCSLFHVALNRGAKPYFILPFSKILSKILSVQGKENSFARALIMLGLPEPSSSLFGWSGWEYILISLLLYCVAFALVYIAGFICMFSVVFSAKVVSKLAASVVGRLVHGSIISWTSSISDFVLEILLRVPPILVCLLIALGSQTCSALSLCIGAIYFYLQICKMYEDYLESLLFYSMRVITGKEKFTLDGIDDPDAKRDNERETKAANTSAIAEDVAAPRPSKAVATLTNDTAEDRETDQNEESRRSLSDINVHVTVFLLYIASLLPCIPSLLFWAHNYRFDTKLDPDPVFNSVILTLISSASCFWLQSFPNRKLRFYGVIADGMFVLAAFVVVFAPTRMNLITPLCSVAMSLIATHQWISSAVSRISDVFNPQRSDAEEPSARESDIDCDSILSEDDNMDGDDEDYGPDGLESDKSIDGSESDNDNYKIKNTEDGTTDTNSDVDVSSSTDKKDV